MVEDENSDAVGLLRSRLLRHQEIINVGFNTNVALSSTSHIGLSADLEVIHGMLFYPGARYNGIALTTQPLPAEHIDSTEITLVGSWLDEYIKTAWWEPFDVSIEDKLEYFNARRTTSNMYKCWESIAPITKEKYMIL